MTTKPTTTIQQTFARRCEELLASMVEQAQKRDLWDIYLAKGAGDRAIAGDHEERHLLELLQNARDAIYRGRLEGDKTPGRVLVAVTERGMAMANTGAPFRLDDEEVLKAVRFLMRSDKAGKGFIGHKGIGLKSILLRAGAFSVRSCIDGDMLRATFSRHRTATHLLDEMRQAPEKFQQQYIQQELHRMPLFTQPHADSADGDALGRDSAVVEALLGNQTESSLGLSPEGTPDRLDPYTTVVYLPYQDEAWERLLDDVQESLDGDNLAAFRRARHQMGTSSAQANAEGLWRELTELDPRVLVLLGEIGEIQFARFSQGRLVEAHRIDVEHPLSPLNGHDDSLTRVRLSLKQWSAQDGQAQPPTQRHFTILSAPTRLGVEEDGQGEEGPEEYVRILLEMPSSDPVALKNEPLFLYYPIEADLSGLPFLIHGPFRVNSSRTALVPSQRDHNRQVLGEAIALLRDHLDALLAPGDRLRRWLPWVLLPQTDPEETPDAAQDKPQNDLVNGVVALLKESACVPTTHGPTRPAEVHFFPDRPDAFSLLEELGVQPDSGPNGLRLLARENRLTFGRLRASQRAHWARVASLIGLGQVDRLSLAQALAEHLGRAAGHDPLPVPADLARTFFLSLCALLVDENKKIDRAAAEVLGQSHVPLLPAFPGTRKNPANQDSLLLVPTESRRKDKAPTAHQAGRVVFWRPASVQARTEDVPPPPDTIPIYFIDPAVVEAEGARAEGILSTLYDEWGTTRFESRPDLFRRVADRAAAKQTGINVVPVLGYLAGLLQSIHTVSFSGADDLQPRPYAAIDLDTLGDFVNEYRRKSTQRTLDRQRLESLQAWSCIPVPTQNEASGPYPAHTVAFGPAWATFLEQALDQRQAESQEEQDPPEATWARAIHALATFRRRIGRPPDHPDYPEIAPPDDPRWRDAYPRLRQVMADQVPDEEESLTPETREKLALFRLLLLLGVRIGPHVRWRWLNRVKSADPFTPQTRAISQEISQALFEAEHVPEKVLPAPLLRSDLLAAYPDFISLEPYHPLFSCDHAQLCRKDMEKTGSMPAHLAAWIWFPDLAQADLDAPPFGGDRDTIDAFRDTLLAAWPDVADRVLWTGWYCGRWHAGRVWKKRIPSLAAFQLLRLPLWSARPDGRVPDLAEKRFPAAVMVAWNKEEAPSATEPAAFLPILDTRDLMDRVARDLEIQSLSELSFPGAVVRLRWLLEESRVEGGPPGCWAISEFEGTSRDAWLAAQYRLLDRIIHQDPGRLWDRRTVVRCGLALRAVQGERQCAVPLTSAPQSQAHFALDVAFFPRPPRYWEREANAERWILETQSQLQTALYRWAETLGAERLPPSDPPAYQGTPVQDSQAVESLRPKVRDRLTLILGVFKAHRAEKLDEKAGRVLNALKTMQPLEPAPGEENWSGLDKAGHLAFSIQGYRQEREAGRSGAVVLAEGLALLVEQTTAVGDLQHALSAPQAQVKRALYFRGVDLDELIREVRALAQSRLKLLLERVERLIQALATAETAPARLPEWQLQGIDDEAWMKEIQTLKAVEGTLADQALDALAAVTPGLAASAHRALLGIVLQEELVAQGDRPLARSLLAVLREAGWDADQRARFARTSDLFDLPRDLAERQEVCRRALNDAVVAALADQLAAGTFDAGEEPERDLAIRGQTLLETLKVRPAETDADFLDHVGRTLGLAPDFEPGQLLVLEWDEETWEALGEAFRQTAEDRLSQAAEEWAALADLLERCLDEGSLDPLRQHHHRQVDQRQRRIRTLEQGLEQGQLEFDPTALAGFETASPFQAAEAITSEPGRRAGSRSLGQVTENQAVRGRLAELFVLEVCWHRYRALDPAGRAQTLEQIEARRADQDGDVPWGTATAWRKLKKRLDAHRAGLIELSADDETLPPLAKLFKDLIQVADERGPGFDVLDPFGVWGQDGPPVPCRVEVKAVLPPQDQEGADGHRVVLSTNEFHRARGQPASYVLRLIYVPRDEDALDQVGWACDVPDPVNVLQLDKQIIKGVRSGSLPFVVRPRADMENG